uniref:Putative secreted protein n=1 Tax=Ixodes ricinus TaxID=34613 RepID=A0A6B0UNP7_IXORI
MAAVLANSASSSWFLSCLSRALAACPSRAPSSRCWASCSRALVRLRSLRSRRSTWGSLGGGRALSSPRRRSSSWRCLDRACRSSCSDSSRDSRLRSFLLAAARASSISSSLREISRLYS